VSLTDAGGYYCKAVNRYGRATVRVHLNVRGQFFSCSLNTVVFSSDLVTFLKGELNLYKNWKSDDFFYVIINEIHPRFNQF